MPPPTAVDAWLSGRRFGIVIDAGSSGSRLQVYSWMDPRNKVAGQSQSFLPKVEKGARDGEDWVTKVEPGLSSFAEDPEAVAQYLVPLLEHARQQIPPSLHATTPLFLLATAGMRLLSSEAQASVLRTSCHFLRGHSHFKIDDPSPIGPCGSSVRIITGEEEGLFGWIAVNYLMDGFTGSSDNQTTYGFLDMGGASTQIAFEPAKHKQSGSKNLVDVRLRLLNGKEIHHEVFVTTWLGYGTNQARERYVGQATADSTGTIHDPCLPKDLVIQDPTAGKLIGTGSFEQCLHKTAPLLNKQAPCLSAPCLFNGVHVPTIDFSVSHFIGVSEYWYSSEHVFGLGGPYDYAQYERAASTFCARDWPGIVEEHERMHPEHAQSHLDHAAVVHPGVTHPPPVWNDKVEISRLEMQCFKAAWVANVLHEGIGLPRLVDPGGNPHAVGGDKVAQHAESKGLGRPTFQSVDTVGDIAISWTLGKMVLEASKEVPLPSNARPLPSDPLDTVSPESAIKQIHPSWMPFDLEDLTEHLPRLPAAITGLHSSAVGIFYLLVLCVFILVGWRLRHLCRASLRIFRRRDDRHSLEEGKAPSRPASPSRRTWLNQAFSGSSTPLTRPKPAPIAALQRRPSLRHAHSSPTRITSRSVSSSIASGSRPGSPSSSASFSFEESASMSSLASRNSSQINLTALTPRLGAISRVNSMHFGPGHHHEY